MIYCTTRLGSDKLSFFFISPSTQSRPMLSPLRFIPEWLFMCVARPLGRGNHFSQTLHWCILDRLLDGFGFFNVIRPPRFCPLVDLGAGDGLR